MTLTVIHWLQTFSNAIRRTFVQHFTRFQLTVCSHDSSALAELLVIFTYRNSDDVLAAFGVIINNHDDDIVLQSARDYKASPCAELRGGRT